MSPDLTMYVAIADGTQVVVEGWSWTLWDIEDIAYSDGIRVGDLGIGIKK